MLTRDQNQIVEMMKHFNMFPYFLRGFLQHALFISPPSAHCLSCNVKISIPMVYFAIVKYIFEQQRITLPSAVMQKDSLYAEVSMDLEMAQPIFAILHNKKSFCNMLCHTYFLLCEWNTINTLTQKVNDVINPVAKK